MNLKEALEERPSFLCPYCSWIVPHDTKKPIRVWKYHVKTDKCYEDM